MSNYHPKALIKKYLKQEKIKLRTIWLKIALKLMKRKNYNGEDVTEYLIQLPNVAGPAWFELKPKDGRVIRSETSREWFFEHAYCFPEIAIKYFIELHKDDSKSNPS